jgi:phage gp46-like protein
MLREARAALAVMVLALVRVGMAETEGMPEACKSSIWRLAHSLLAASAGRAARVAQHLGQLAGRRARVGLSEAVYNGVVTMPDIKITWDSLNNRGDWTVAIGDLVTGDDLETMVLVCLFSDRVLPADMTPPDGSSDHRGWPGDSYMTLPIGSRLWTLARRSISSVSQLLADALDICNEALAPLLTDGIAQTVVVNTYYISRGQLGITVVITEPSGTVTNFNYQYAWQGVFA